MPAAAVTPSATTMDAAATSVVDGALAEMESDDPFGTFSRFRLRFNLQ